MKNLGRDTNGGSSTTGQTSGNSWGKWVRKSLGSCFCGAVCNSSSHNEASIVNILTALQFRQLCVSSKILRWSAFAFYGGRPQLSLRSLLLDVPLHVTTTSGISDRRQKQRHTHTHTHFLNLLPQPTVHESWLELSVAGVFTGRSRQVFIQKILCCKYCTRLGSV